MLAIGMTRGAFPTLGILTLPSHYIFVNLLFVKQNEESFVPHAGIHGHDTRNKMNLVAPCWRLKRCQSGPGYWSIKFFNKLPQDIRGLPFKQFRDRVRALLMDNAFYSHAEYLSFKF